MDKKLRCPNCNSTQCYVAKKTQMINCRACGKSTPVKKVKAAA